MLAKKEMEHPLWRTEKSTLLKKNDLKYFNFSFFFFFFFFLNFTQTKPFTDIFHGFWSHIHLEHLLNNCFRNSYSDRTHLVTAFFKTKSGLKSLNFSFFFQLYTNKNHLQIFFTNFGQIYIWNIYWTTIFRNTYSDRTHLVTASASTNYS